MNCPKCKKKLSTKRTTAEKDKVYRERYCEKCKYTYGTIEIIESTLLRERADFQERLDKLSDLYEEETRENEETRELVNTFYKFIKKTK